MKRLLIEQMRAQDPALFSVDAGAQVDAVFTALRAALDEHGRITIPGFGAFTLKQLPERPVRNPKSGAITTRPAEAVIKFKGTKK